MSYIKYGCHAEKHQAVPIGKQRSYRAEGVRVAWRITLGAMQSREQKPPKP